jgi:hypothetical protein
MSVGKNIAITGAGNANTGFSVLAGWDLTLSAAATVTIREGASNGTIVAQIVATGAGPWAADHSGSPIICAHAGTGTFFVENSAGNIAGGVFGNA